MSSDNSIVLDLQRDALDQNCPVSTLLRKSMVVAKKLGLREFKDWISSELSGYRSEPPDYRKVHGMPKAWNEYRGWIPLMSEDSEIAEILAERPVYQSIAELEEIASRDDTSSTLGMPYAQPLQRHLGEVTGFATQFALIVQRASLTGILDAVRSAILEWTLKLEEEGILGEGLSFSDIERQSAQSIPQGTNIFMGSIENQQFAQNSPESIQVSAHLDLNLDDVSSFLTQLVGKIDDLGLSTVLRQELDSEIATVDSQAKSPRPKARIIREGLSSIKRILESASAPLAGDLVKSLGALLSVGS